MDTTIPSVLHPCRAPRRYLMYGDVSARVAEEMRKPDVADFFARLIQRVAPKSYAQASPQQQRMCPSWSPRGGGGGTEGGEERVTSTRSVHTSRCQLVCERTLPLSQPPLVTQVPRPVAALWQQLCGGPSTHPCAPVCLPSPQAMAELKVTRMFFHNFGGDQVRRVV